MTGKPKPTISETEFQRYYPTCNFIGISDKESLARDEIRSIERHLEERGFSLAQIHQHKAEIFDSSIPGEEDRAVALICAAKDYFHFLDSLGGLDLAVYRAETDEPDIQSSPASVLSMKRLLEAVPLLKLVSNDMSQQRFELVHGELLRRSREAEYAKVQKAARVRGGDNANAANNAIREAARREWPEWQPTAGKKTKTAFHRYFYEKHEKPADVTKMYKWLKGA